MTSRNLHSIVASSTPSKKPSLRWAAILGLALICGSFWNTFRLSADDEDADNPVPKGGVVATAKGGLKPITSFTKFPDTVACVAFSADGKMLAAGSYGVTQIFDLAEKTEIAALKEKAGFVRSLAFSPDSKFLVAGTYQAVTVWDVATKQSIKSLPGHRGYVTAAVFSKDGGTLATACEDEAVRLWNTSTWDAGLTFKKHTRPVTCVALSTDGKLAASCSGDVTRPTKRGEVLVWDMKTGEVKQTLEEHDRAVNAVAFSSDNKLLASSSFDETIKLWDLESGKELKTLEGHSRPVNSIAFSPDGKTLLSGGGGRFVGGNDIRFWDVASGKPLGKLSGHDGPVNQVAISSDGKMLAAASSDKSVSLWDLPALLTAAQAKLDATKTVAAVDPVKKPAEEKAATEQKEEKKEGAAEPVKELRAGIIGLDTSHVIAFTKELNAKDPKEDVAHCRVVAAYPKGSPDIESSTKRVAGYTMELQGLGVEIVDSIDTLLTKVDVVFLETNDGRPHLEQVLPVLKAGKRVFIDKPIAGTLADAIAIFDASTEYKVPLFSCSSLRFGEATLAVRNGKIGDILGCDTTSPCSLEKTHPDLFWYGIHGVESLFTVMGTGCEKVTRVSTPGADFVTGYWKGGRIGTFRGIRNGKADYLGTAYGTKGNESVGKSSGYRPLVVEIVKYFRTGMVPVSPEETLEIYAFMEAADESKRQGGIPITLESVMAKARTEVKTKAGK